MIAAAFFISLIACILGSAGGVGGGVIIKPTLDLVFNDSVSTITFLSGCTVLAMSTLSVARSAIKREKRIKIGVVLPLSIGSAIGGVGGKFLFVHVDSKLAEGSTVLGVLQSSCLLALTVGSFLYILFRAKIKVRHLQSKTVCTSVGLALGAVSSFLGIGGGPINLVVFLYLFGMDTKTAAENSLFVIIVSQLSSLIFTVAIHKVPVFEPWMLVLMILGALIGALLGQKLQKKLSEKQMTVLLSIIMLLIIASSVATLIKLNT